VKNVKQTELNKNKEKEIVGLSNEFHIKSNVSSIYYSRHNVAVTYVGGIIDTKNNISNLDTCFLGVPPRVKERYLRLLLSCFGRLKLFESHSERFFGCKINSVVLGVVVNTRCENYAALCGSGCGWLIICSSGGGGGGGGGGGEVDIRRYFGAGFY